MTRRGMRRAAVLLALGEMPKGIGTICRETLVPRAGVVDILDSLSACDLAARHMAGGWVLGTGNVAEATAQARALLEQRVREVVGA